MNFWFLPYFTGDFLYGMCRTIFRNILCQGVCMYVCMYVSMQANSVSAAFHFFVSLVGSGVLKVALKDQYRCVCMYVRMCECMSLPH